MSQTRLVPTPPPDYEVLILAPVGLDAEAAANVLNENRLVARPFKSLTALCERLNQPAGMVLIAEEALSVESLDSLKSILALQPPWSSLPIVLMTSSAARILSTESILAELGAGGAISILERPFRVVTLLAAVKVALQAREKQYQVRDLLAYQDDALKQRDEFLSIASHELKTPITSLKLQVQMRKRFLKRGDPSVFSPEKVISLIETTETQVDRLSRLVDDMLDISRIVNGKLSLNCEPVELGHIVEEVVTNFSTQFQAAGCTVDLKVEDRAQGNWDRYRIEQVVANLLSNSIKYGQGNPVLVTVNSGGGKASIRVKDHGTGIPPEHHERIFQRFERAVDGNGISGLGLGLYITRQILDLHSAKIRVESIPGQGSTFIVDLPLAEESTARAAI